MLVLTQKIDEPVYISDNITLHILSVKGNQVQIGYDAPKEVKIYRDKAYQKIKNEQ